MDSSSAQTPADHLFDHLGVVLLVENRLSDVLTELARTLATDFPIQGILDHLVQRIVDILPIDAAGVTLITATTDPRFIAASDESANRFERLQSALGEGPCIAAFETDGPISIPNLAEDDRFPKFAKQALDEGLVAVFTFPLRHGEHCLGALDLYRTSAGPLDDHEMAAAQTLADVATAYLLNAQARVDLKVASASARHIALHDALTGLANRTLLVSRLEHALARSSRSGKCVGVLFADLDRFKQVNDTFGHHVGDELLVAVAARLNLLVRPSDTVARLSGDEFVVVCEDMDNVARGRLVAARIRLCLREPFKLSHTELRVTASVGIAASTATSDLPRQRVGADPDDDPASNPFEHQDDDQEGQYEDPDHSPDPAPDDSPDDSKDFRSGDVPAAEQLLRRADAAMYQVKKAGGDGCGFVDMDKFHQSTQRSNLIDDLRTAHKRGELRLEYQPIVTTGDRHVVGAEALLRWSHRLRGPIDPALFVSIAEQSGLIGDIGRTVLHQACHELSSWHPNGNRPGLSVNVSPHQLMSATFVHFVQDTLAEAEVSPGLLTLEVTENALIQDRARALSVLRSLRQLGVHIALDDFGTGSSSLTNLRDFPVDMVKIDRGFVSEVGTDDQSRHIVEAVVKLAHRLGMRTVAEGVETDEQYERIVELGCDLYQGHHFAPSLSADAFRHLGEPTVAP